MKALVKSHAQPGLWLTDVPEPTIGINDVLIPEGISGFGQELATRFVDHLSLITGALPAQFGYRTAGIVDIHTKSGISLNGGDISLYGALVATGQRWALCGGYLFAAVLMLAAAVVEWCLGVPAERRPLEALAEPLSSSD